MIITENKTKTSDKSIFFISPVNNINSIDKILCENHINQMNDEGREIYFPLRNTIQTGDKTGYRICTDNKIALNYAKGVHFYLTKGTKGSFFDVGMSMIRNKQIYLVNQEKFNLNDKVEKAIVEYSMIDIERSINKISKLFYELKDYRNEILEAKEDFAFNFKYDKEHLLKLGMLFNSKKEFYISNINEIEKTPTKSFQNLVHEINKRYEQK